MYLYFHTFPLVNIDTVPTTNKRTIKRLTIPSIFPACQNLYEVHPIKRMALAIYINFPNFICLSF